MPRFVPPHLQATFQQVQQAFKQVHGSDLDVQKTPWAEIEKGIVKLLGGPFDMNQPNHQAIALSLAFVLGERLVESEKGFWFPNRDTPEGVMIGFPEALLTVSTFTTVMDALRRAKLELLDQVAADVRRSVASVKFAPQAGGQAPRLTEMDYARLFDPAFLQFVAYDTQKLNQAFDTKPDKLASDVRDALSRVQEMPPEAKQQFEAQVVGSLRRLDASKPLSASVPAAPRLGELAAHLFAASGATGAAPAEFWDEVVLPLLFIGEPQKFPPIDKEDLEALDKGVDPLALFLDLVPFTTPAPEEGLLGTFNVDELSMPHASFNQVPNPRLIAVKPDRLAALLKAYDPAKEKAVLEKFDAHLEQLSGKKVKHSAQTDQMRDAALSLLADLKRVVEMTQGGKGTFCIRRLTETEAMSEAALAAVRKALSGPRIILA